jgi:hypothetical protein
MTWWFVSLRCRSWESKIRFFLSLQQISVTYAALFQSAITTSCEQEGHGNKVGCQLMTVLATWCVVAWSLHTILWTMNMSYSRFLPPMLFTCRLMFAVVLSAFGFVVVLPLSWGNSPSHRDLRRMMVSLLLALAYAV